jgi:DNA polymerase elongation subunit (family B)
MEDISKTIKKLDLKQNAIKLLINSIYGAFGNKWFYFYNTDIAQSITLQGQDLIGFSIKAVNHYFMNMWHTDTELHEKLGISQFTIEKIDDEAAIYTDTDSIYVQFDSAIKSIKGASFNHEEALTICVGIDRYRLAEYYEKCFDKYGKLFNTKNRQTFKLENLSEAGIWLKKKNYAIKVAYEPNPQFELIPREKRYLIIKGLEPIKGSYPIWARNTLYKLDEFIMAKGTSLDIERDIIPKLKALKDEFNQLSIDEVAFNFKIRIYNKYVESEKDLKLLKGISIYPRAAAYYNHLLIKGGLLEKYKPVRENDKIKFYYCAPNKYEFDVFAYNPESFPEEISPPMDRDQQFYSLIVEPTNRILEAMKLGTVDIKLDRAVEYITVKSKKELSDDQIYPLYAVNKSTLDRVEVAQKFWKIIGNPDAQPNDEDFTEYLATITTYGMDTVIVPKFELPKYLKRIEKKLEKEANKSIIEDDEDDN